MQFSPQTLELISEVTKFSNNRIKNPDDICFLIELSQSAGKRVVFNQLTFYAKYLNGLSKILQSGQIAGLQGSDVPRELGVKPEETLLKIKGEYTDHLKKLLTLLEQYISGTDLEPAGKFKKNYLEMTQPSLRNLNTLIYDLTWVKNWMNRNNVKIKT